MVLEIDLIGAIGFGAIYLALFILWFKADNARMRESREKYYWRNKYREQCATRTSEAEQDAKRAADKQHATEIEASELKAQLKAAGMIADGWRKAAEKRRSE